MWSKRPSRAAHSLRVALHLVLHGNELNHEEVDRLVGALDGQQSIDNGLFGGGENKGMARGE